MKLWKKVIFGLILGIILGFVLQDKVVYLKPFGDLFIRLIKMIIVPLIFFAIVSGMINAENSKTLGRVGGKALLAYIGTTIFAVCIGFGVGGLLTPGAGIDLKLEGSNLEPPQSADLTKILDIILEIIPDNALGAMAQGMFIQVVFFALFTGITINLLEKNDSKKISEIVGLASKLVFKMVNLIMSLSPMAACALTAWIVGTQGSIVLISLLKLILCTYLAFMIQYFVYGLMIYVVTKLPIKPFYKKSFEYQSIAFATSSSKAALPTTIRVCQESLGISKFGSSFILPLGASINMNGIAIYICICTLFFAQATGKVLSFSDYGLITLMSTLGSIGGAGIPGGTIVMLPMVLGAIGLPIEGIALIAGIDRIVDMMRTTISITGDVAVTICIDYSEDSLDKERYLG